jgi:uncharacterized protein (TIGR03066 family)
MKAKTRKTNNQPQPQASNANPTRFSPSKWFVALIVIALVAGSAFAIFTLVLPDKVPPELIGAWRVVDGPLGGMTLEFRRDGAMTGKAMVAGEERELEGTAEVVGTTLRTTTKNPFTNRAETGTQTIVSLTETELVTQDTEGMRVKMTRLR